MKALLFLAGLLVLAFLFFIQRVLTKPVYNKMSNVWEEDTDSRKLAHLIIIGMVVIGFLLGLLVR